MSKTLFFNFTPDVDNLMEALWDSFQHGTNESNYFYSYSNNNSKGYPNYPKMNHYLMEDGTNVLEIAVTGFEKEEVSAEVKNNTLRIIAKKKEEVEKSKLEKRYFCKGLGYSDFDVTFNITSKMDITAIQSYIHQGVLEIKIPMKAEEKPVSRKLEIN